MKLQFLKKKHFQKFQNLLKLIFNFIKLKSIIVNIMFIYSYLITILISISPPFDNLPKFNLLKLN